MRTNSGNEEIEMKDEKKEIAWMESIIYHPKPLLKDFGIVLY